MTNEYVKKILDKGYLVSPDAVGKISSENVNLIIRGLSEIESKPFIVDSIVLDKVLAKGMRLDERASAKSSSVFVVNPYKDDLKKYSVQDFVLHFKKRYESLKYILMNRPEFKDAVSINRVSSKQNGERVSIIGLVNSKSETKNGNVMLRLEDPTGVVNVLINKNRQEVVDVAKQCLLDEVVGVTGAIGDKIIFSDSLVLPDIPVINELKKCPDEGYIVFISDLHYGIKFFLREEFDRFLQWINGGYGSEKHKEIASKVKYLIIAGDLVEGIGIYPGQEKDLEINDIYLQYDGLAKELKRVPSAIQVIIAGGNHDALRMSEPQPQLDPKYAKPIYELNNVYIVPNPSTVNLHASPGFPGLNVLVYHGFSLPFIAEAVEDIRVAGGQSKSDLIMKYQLQRRHLAPEHGMNLYIPDSKKDPLVIDVVPDIFVTGHIHRVAVGNYRGVTMINSSCWVSQTDDQEKRGIVPEAARAVVVNMKTREVSVLNFNQDE